MKSFVDALSFPIIGDPSQQDRHAGQDDPCAGIPERHGSLLTRAGNRISEAFIEIFSVWDALSLRLLEMCLIVSARNSFEQRD